jgi:hypothetical protein
MEIDDSHSLSSSLARQNNFQPSWVSSTVADLAKTLGVSRAASGGFYVSTTSAEWQNLKSQIVISSWGGLRRAAPYAF